MGKIQISKNREVNIQRGVGMPCYAKIFNIGDQKAYQDDFGHKEDTLYWMAEPYGCGFCEFIVKEPTNDILNKYDITEEDYEKIAEALKEELFVGGCSLCE